MEMENIRMLMDFLGMIKKNKMMQIFSIIQYGFFMSLMINLIFFTNFTNAYDVYEVGSAINENLPLVDEILYSVAEPTYTTFDCQKAIAKGTLYGTFVSSALILSGVLIAPVAVLPVAAVIGLDATCSGYVSAGADYIVEVATIDYSHSQFFTFASVLVATIATATAGYWIAFHLTNKKNDNSVDTGADSINSNSSGVDVPNPSIVIRPHNDSQLHSGLEDMPESFFVFLSDFSFNSLLIPFIIFCLFIFRFKLKKLFLLSLALILFYYLGLTLAEFLVIDQANTFLFTDSSTADPVLYSVAEPMYSYRPNYTLSDILKATVYSTIVSSIVIVTTHFLTPFIGIPVAIGFWYDYLYPNRIKGTTDAILSSTTSDAHLALFLCVTTAIIIIGLNSITNKDIEQVKHCGNWASDFVRSLKTKTVSGLNSTFSGADHKPSIVIHPHNDSQLHSGLEDIPNSLLLFLSEPSNMYFFSIFILLMLVFLIFKGKVSKRFLVFNLLLLITCIIFFYLMLKSSDIVTPVIQVSCNNLTEPLALYSPFEPEIISLLSVTLALGLLLGYWLGKLTHNPVPDLSTENNDTVLNSGLEDISNSLLLFLSEPSNMYFFSFFTGLILIVLIFKGKYLCKMTAKLVNKIVYKLQKFFLFNTRLVHFTFIILFYLVLNLTQNPSISYCSNDEIIVQDYTNNSTPYLYTGTPYKPWERAPTFPPIDITVQKIPPASVPTMLSMDFTSSAGVHKSVTSAASMHQSVTNEAIPAIIAENKAYQMPRYTFSVDHLQEHQKITLVPISEKYLYDATVTKLEYAKLYPRLYHIIDYACDPRNRYTIDRDYAVPHFNPYGTEISADIDNVLNDNHIRKVPREHVQDLYITPLCKMFIETHNPAYLHAMTKVVSVIEANGDLTYYPNMYNAQYYTFLSLLKTK